MTTEEANKVNALYKRLDELTAENVDLKKNKDVGATLESIEAKLDKLLDKGKTK